MNPLHRLAPLLAAFVLLPATAQTIWRCADGRSFGDRPCAGGRAVDVEPAPTAQAAQEARILARAEQRALQRLAAERRERERHAVAAPAGIRMPSQPVVDRDVKAPPARDGRPHRRGHRGEPAAPWTAPPARAPR